MSEETAERKFLNVKIRNVRKQIHTQLTWREPGKGDWVTRSLDDPEPAAESFYEALTAFIPWVQARLAAAIGMVKISIAGEMKILGVSYKYSDEGDYHVMVSATMALPGFNSPLVLNFPPSTPDKELKSLLEQLQNEAGFYIEGERGQLEMDLEPGEEGADTDGTQESLEV